MTAAELDALHLASISGPRCPRTDKDGFACGGVAHLEGDGLVCGACGTEYGGTYEERKRARKADEAHVLWQRQHEPLRGLEP